MIVALIVIGGGAGAVLRWLTTLWLGTTDAGFPVGTTVVNVVGSFVLGMVYGLNISISVFDAEPLTAGILGGFTTFSTWMVEIDDAPERRPTVAVTTVPLIAGIAAAALGLILGRAV